MTNPARENDNADAEPVRVLGRGLRAKRGVRMTLRSVREAAGLTQVGVSDKSHINQGDVSRLESRTDFDDCQVATLQRYIDALGGQLELVARFGDKRITIVGVQRPDVDPDATKDASTD
jgi:hypothetical protein